MKRLLTNALMMCMYLLLLMPISCKKETDEDFTENNLNSVIVYRSFNWSTTKEYTLNLTGYANSLVQIESTDGITYAQSMLVKDSIVSVNLTVPSYFTKVNLTYMGKSYEVLLANKTISLAL